MNENKKCCTGVEKLFCNANCSVVKGSKVHQLHSYNYLYFLNTIAGFDFIHSASCSWVKKSQFTCKTNIIGGPKMMKITSLSRGELPLQQISTGAIWHNWAKPSQLAAETSSPFQAAADITLLPLHSLKSMAGRNRFEIVS